VKNSAADSVGSAGKTKSSMKMILFAVLEAVRVAILCIVTMDGYGDGNRMLMTFVGINCYEFSVDETCSEG